MSQSASRRATPRQRASSAKRESKHVDFKDRFDPASAAEWCELVKDFAALANSGGGVLVIGLKSNGDPSGADPQPTLNLDPAMITDKLFSYTGIHQAGFDVFELNRAGVQVAAIGVEASRALIVFTKPGTYLEPGIGKQKTAFSRGTIYFRHGAKSEPATPDDLADFIDRRVERAREEWLGNIRKVVEAPGDALVAVYRATARNADGEPTRIQLTTDPKAPVFGRLHPDETHPHRQREVLHALNERLPPGAGINSHDLLAVRRANNINEQTQPQFCYQPKYASMQYSDSFVDWILDRWKDNPKYFEDARTRYLLMQQRKGDKK